MDDLHGSNRRRLLIWHHALPARDARHDFAAMAELRHLGASTNHPIPAQTQTEGELRTSSTLWLSLPGLALATTAAGLEVPDGAAPMMWAKALLVLTGFGMTLWPLFALYSQHRERLGRRARAILWDHLATGRPLDARGAAALRKVIEDPRLPEEARQSLAISAYFDSLEKLMEDAERGDADLTLVNQLEHVLPLRRESFYVARLQVFWDRYFAAVADHPLSAREEARMDHVRKALGIPSARDTVKSDGRLAPAVMPGLL